MGKVQYARLVFDIRSDGKQLGKFKRHQAHSDPQLSTHAATDDRCANFSASTCPTQALQQATSSTVDKLPLEKFHRLLDLGFWVKFLKLSSISLFVFFGEFYRVSLNPVF
jgi:ferredoxin